MGKVMRNFRHFLASKKGQIVLNVLYSWGAAIVIFGALCKIMYYPIGNILLPLGMIVEVFVFIISGFDYSSTNDDVEANANGLVIGGALLGGSAVGNPDSQSITSETRRGKVEGSSGSVVVVGGAGGSVTGSNTISPSQGTVAGSRASSIDAASLSSSSSVSSHVGGYSDKSVTPEYAQSLSNTAQNLEDFSNTIHSLNEASRKMLDAYKQVTETQGFAENLATLNQNVSGLNDVFNGQLQTINEQMSAIRYINDSLQRMKNLYDGAIGDSYMFREESAKMTKHIEALNNVYARLLQAMTTNNNNMNQTNF